MPANHSSPLYVESVKVVPIALPSLPAIFMKTLPAGEPAVLPAVKLSVAACALLLPIVKVSPTVVIADCVAPVTVAAVPLTLPVTFPVNGPANAVAVTVPLTCSLVEGVAFPIPNLPADSSK